MKAALRAELAARSGLAAGVSICRLSADDVRNIRARLGVMQSYLAVAIGVTVTSVSRWENGHNRPPPCSWAALRLRLLEGDGRALFFRMLNSRVHDLAARAVEARGKAGRYANPGGTAYEKEIG